MSIDEIISSTEGLPERYKAWHDDASGRFEYDQKHSQAAIIFSKEQVRIRNLCYALRKAIEGLRFYADCKEIDIIVSGEEEFHNGKWHPLGEKARETLKDIEG